MVWLWVTLGIVALLVIITIAIYNALVRLRVRVDEAWSDITVQLKRRADLIPNLLESVKGYAAHEKEVFEKVTEARSAIMGATKEGPRAAAAAENQFEDALKSLFAVAENYPQLRANENFLQMQAEITDTEDKVQASRRFYNGGVRDLNTKIQTFPSNIFAAMFGFKQREFFEVEDRAAVEEAPKVSF
ncbi:MAG: LemA family protein [Sphaerimonospora mesophila]